MKKEILKLSSIKFILIVIIVASVSLLLAATVYLSKHSKISLPVLTRSSGGNTEILTPIIETPSADALPDDKESDIATTKDPVFPGAGVPAAALVHRFSQPDGYVFCAILVGDERQHAYYLADCDLDYFEQARDIEIYKGEDNYWRYKKNNTVIIARDTCALAPAAYAVQCKEVNFWLDQKISEWKPKEYKPMVFGAMNNIPMNGLSYEFADEYERGIEETGIDFIRTDLPKFSDAVRETEALANLSKLIKSAQSRGKKVMIGNNVNGDKEYFGTKSISWAEYSEKQKEYLRTAANFNPDYIAVILEPVVVVDPKVNKYRYLNFKESVTPKMWGKLIKESISIIKAIDSNIKTAIGIIPQNQYEQEFFAEVLNSKIDIVGVDIYGISGVDATDKILIPEWKSTGGTKEFWIMETWAGGIEFEGSVDQLWKKDIDGKWLKAMAYYSQQNDIKGMNVFYSKHFFSYDKVVINDIERLREAIKTSRTSVFYVYKRLIEEIKNGLTVKQD